MYYKHTRTQFVGKIEVIIELEIEQLIVLTVKFMIGQFYDFNKVVISNLLLILWVCYSSYDKDMG